MATKNIRLGALTPAALHLGSTKIRRCYLGVDMVWDEPVFVDEPKIDPQHALANRATTTMLVAGDPTDTTLVLGSSTVTDEAFASTTPGNITMRTKAMPAPNTTTFRVSALIKVDKTAGRYSRFGFATGALGSSPDAAISYTAGAGFISQSSNFALTGAGATLLAEAKCVDLAWYRATIIYDNVTTKDTSDTNSGKARISFSVEPVDPLNIPANPWYPETLGARFDAVGAGAHVPSTIFARTNSALGTIKDVYYIDSALGATSNGTVNGGDPVDNAPIVMTGRMGAGTDAADLYYLWSKGKAAPLRVILTSGGTGTYGGIGGFGHANGRTGHPWDAMRKFWRDLADLGYTVLHTQALHEGWGADDHLSKQLEALTTMQNEFGVDVRLYYFAYSMGGISMWRAIRGRAGFPLIRAAYSVAGISRLDPYYDNATFAAIKTRWPVRANLDEPQSWAAADLTSRGTRVRMVTSTGDTNVDKALEHDPMFAKYAGSGLATELVHSGIGHFDPSYWDAQDCVNFFEGADA